MLSPVVTVHPLCFLLGRVKVLRKFMKQGQKVNLLKGFGETSTFDYKVSQNASKYIRTLCYAGLKTENLVDFRVRLYKKMKTKTLLILSPEPKSMEQTILRIHHQPYFWLRFDTKDTDVINNEKFG